jgi:hypothetical protein
MGTVADSDALGVHCLGQLLRNLGQYIEEGGRGLDGQAKLSLCNSQHSPEPFAQRTKLPGETNRKRSCFIVSGAQ